MTKDHKHKLNLIRESCRQREKFSIACLECVADRVRERDALLVFAKKQAELEKTENDVCALEEAGYPMLHVRNARKILQELGFEK